MKEAIVNADNTVSIHDTSIPEPAAGQVLIKVLVSGTNPKDWKLPLWTKRAHNSGDDVAGLIQTVGPGVTGFRQGDRVAGFHVMTQPHGSFAEYAIVPAFTTFHVPESITYESAATIPLAAYTAAVAIHHALRLPSPWDAKDPDKKNTPVIVYGASTAIGAYGIKLLVKADVHPVIAVGSKTSSFVTPLLEKEKGDTFVDYTTFDSQDKLADELAGQLKRTGAKQFRAYDCVTDNETWLMLSKALVKAGGEKHILTTVLPGKDYSGIDSSIEHVVTSVGRIFKPEEAGTLFGSIWTTALAEGLKDGWFTPHPYEVVNGLEGVEGALKKLKEGNVRGKKMVIRIAEGN